MATKTVALDEEAYAVLKRAKKPDESFSDVVKRVVVPRRPLSQFAGIWKDMPPADFEAFEGWRAASRKADLDRQRRLLRKGG
jgi:predicted CopG family antitoxin